MKRPLRLLLVGAVSAVTAVVVWMAFNLHNMDVTVPWAPPPENEKPAQALTRESVIERLRVAGLNEDPVLGDTAISGHMARVSAGKDNLASLAAYADALITLRKITREAGAEIPSSFWDVSTPALRESRWTPAAIVEQLISDDGRPYARVLAKAFARFLAFKNGKNEGDTAVATAFDILEIASDYVDSIPAERLLQHSPKLDTPTAAKLMAWQTLVAGSTRRVPVLGIPLYTHGFVARFNVSTIYQYHVGKAMNLSKTWGVSGFHPRFVGSPHNLNQIEHLSISTLLQAVVGEPVLALNAIEEETYLRGKADKGEANADIALNNAIHDTFIPLFREDLKRAADALEKVLTSEP